MRLLRILATLGGGWRTIMPPAGFVWTPPVTIQQCGASFRVLEDVSAFAPTGVAYYVDGLAGNDGAAGTEGAPLKTIDVAVAKADAAVVYVKPSTVYDYSVTLSNWITKNISIIRWPGYTDNVVITNHLKLAGYVWTPDGNAYKTNIGGWPVYSMIDAGVVDGNGDYRKMTAAADAATVDATPGSWYKDVGNVLWIRAFDDRVPDANLWPSVGASAKAQGNVTVYLEGLSFYGNNYPFWMRNTGAGQTPRLYVKDCEFSYSTALGLYIAGVDTIILQGCTLCVNYDDGANYTALNAVICHSVENNCTMRHNGHVGGAATYNGSSGHDDGSLVRINSTYPENVGPNILDTGESWCIACNADDSAADVVGQNIGFCVQGEMWLHKCHATGNDADITPLAASTIYTRSCTYVTTGGAGAIQPY